MGKYRKILAAFDGSISSKNALRQAIKLARSEKSWLKVLAVVPSYEGDLELVGVRDIKNVMKGPTDKLIKEAQDIAAEEGATIITNIEQGEAYERIVNVAASENCDIIVMGRRGVHRIEKMLMGSATSRVIGHTDKDVLVVPRDTTIGWDHILLASDGSKYSMAATDHAINFARSYGGTLTGVAVVDVTDEFSALAPETVDRMIEKSKSVLEDLSRKATSSGVRTETFVKEGEAYRVIVDLAREKKTDVIFMGSHGRTGIKKFLIGSVTEKVIGYAPCPVMIVKE